MIDRSLFVHAIEPYLTRLVSQLREDAATGCWLWCGATNSSERGFMNVAGRTVGVHRVAFEWANGAVFCYLDVDHVTCDNGLCCNPSHMTEATHARNSQRAFAARRTYTQSIVGKFIDATGMTYEHVAHAIGRRVSTVKRLVRNEAKVDAALALRLADLMAIDVGVVVANFPPRDKSVCGRGLHSLSDDSNVLISKDGRRRRCRACAAADAKAWHAANRDRWNAYQREYQRELRARRRQATHESIQLEKAS